MLAILDTYIGAADAAKLTGLALRTILELCRTGRADAVLIGGRYVIASTWAKEERDRRARPRGCVSVSEATELAQVTRQRIHRLINAGRIKSVVKNTGPRSRRLWVRRRSLENWITLRDARRVKNVEHQDT